MNRLYRPRSFLSLLLTGFLFVSLPLVIALFSAIQIMDGLVQQSAGVVFRSVSRIDSSRKVIDQLHGQERAARLYSVLGDPAHLADVDRSHRELDELFLQFAQSTSEQEVLQLLERLRVKESSLVTMLNSSASSEEAMRRLEQEKALEGYGEIELLAVQLERLCNALMGKEVRSIRQLAQSNKKTLILQVSGLIAFSLLLVALFIALIIQPVHQLDRAIEQLGEGDFATPIVVAGPKDLETLGGKLDWLRKRLDTLDREKVRMLAHISHELKTPLSSIKEGAGLLKEGLVGPLSQSQEEVVSILDSNCTKLQKLIQNILDFNMAQAREAPPEIERVQLDRLVEEVAEDHRNAMLARRISLATTLEAVTVEGDRKQLRTVLDNLLGNAVKFIQDGGEIRVFLGQKGNTAQVVVEDNGPGIAEEDRAQIFLPFFQGNQKNRSIVKGSGLGLAVSKEYAQNCGGTLRLLSSSQGARFLLTLPCAEERVS